MYFDPEPKSSKKDLFDFEKEYASLTGAIRRGDRLVALRGTRRTGKTSLLKVAYSEIDNPKTFIDGRVIEPKAGRILSILIESALNALAERFPDIRARELLKGIGVSALGVGLEVSLDTKLKTLQDIDKLLGTRKTRLTIMIDEVQKLKAGRVDGIIAHAYEHTKNIQFVMAGSEVQLVDEVLGERAESDLYGRPKTIIPIERLPGEKCIEFLRAGFAQKHRRIPDEACNMAVENFDGIIGWHTLFGYYALTSDFDSALKKVVEEGKKIVAEEINSFLAYRPGAKRRYLTVLRLLKNEQRWSDVKNALAAKEGRPVNDRLVSKYLGELEKYGFIIKTEAGYVSADPMASRAAEMLAGTRSILKR